MKPRMYSQMQDQQQWQDPRLHDPGLESEYAEWAEERDAEDQIHFLNWLETPTGIDWIIQVTRPRKEWTLDEFIASPEGKAWVYGLEEAASGLSWID